VLTPKPYPRGKKRWRVIEIVPCGARSEQHPYYFHTESDAWRFYYEKQMELGGRSVLQRALDDYGDYKRKARRKRKTSNEAAHTRKVDGTIKKARQRVERFFRGMTGTDLLELRIGHVQKLYDVSADDGISTVHRNNSLAEAKAFLRWAYKEGLVARSVYDGLDQVEAEGERETGADGKKHRLDELRAFMIKCLDLYDRSRDLGALAALMMIRIHSRSEDLLAIKVRDVNDGARAVYLPDAKTTNGVGYRPLDCEATRERLLSAIEGKGPDDHVFPSTRTNSHMKWRFLNRAIKRICRAALVPVINAKQLRASASELKALAGDPLEAVGRAMGHSPAAGGAVVRRSYASSDAVAQIDATRINSVIGELN
jgi:integrase